MNYLLYIAILPVVLLLAYIYKKDVHKEPGKVLAKIFFFGILTIIPAAIIEMILSPYFPTDNYRSIGMLLLSVFIAVGLVEETVKWLVIKLIIYKSEHFDETFDGIVYAVFASLGFACIENILYVVTTGVGTGIIRAITAVPLHACTGIIMGYFIGKAKLNSNSSKEFTNIVLSLLVPTIVHTIYDFLIFTKKTEFILAWVLFVIIVYIVCFLLVKSSTKSNESTNSIQKVEAISVEEINQESENIETNNQNIEPLKGKFCTYCGEEIDGSNFCAHCGKENN